MLCYAIIYITSKASAQGGPEHALRRRAAPPVRPAEAEAIR